MEIKADVMRDVGFVAYRDPIDVIRQNFPKFQGFCTAQSPQPSSSAVQTNLIAIGKSVGKLLAKD